MLVVVNNCVLSLSVSHPENVVHPRFNEQVRWMLSQWKGQAEAHLVSTEGGNCEELVSGFVMRNHTNSFVSKTGCRYESFPAVIKHHCNYFAFLSYDTTTTTIAMNNDNNNEQIVRGLSPSYCMCQVASVHTD